MLKNTQFSLFNRKEIIILLSFIILILSFVLNNVEFKNIKIRKKTKNGSENHYLQDNKENSELQNIQKFRELLQNNIVNFNETTLTDITDINIDSTDLNYIINYKGGELEPEWAWVKNISIVYTWVDGSDTNFLDLKSKFNGGIRQVNSRDRSADELRYSLRSLKKYMPWHQGTIYIVTSQQIPKWLNTQHPQIKMVYHKDIFPPHIYPTYDSNTIELFFDKIPGITERFLYFNDDVFLNNYVHPCFFFTSGTFYPKVYRNIIRKIDENTVKRIIQSNNIHEIFQASKYYTRRAIREYFDPEFEFRDLFHTVHVFYRDLFEPYRQLFTKELRNVCSNRFRHPTKIHTIYLYQAFMQYATEHDEFPWKLGGQGKVREFKGYSYLPTNRTIEKYSCKIISPMIANQFIKFGRISDNSRKNNRYFHLYKTSPTIYVYNLNDAYSKDRSLYEFTEYMITRYPEPTPFEKKEYVSLEKVIPSQMANIDKNLNTIVNSINNDFKDNNILTFKNMMTKYKLNVIRDYLDKKESLSSYSKKAKSNHNVIKTDIDKIKKRESMSQREKDELLLLLKYQGEELSPEWQWSKDIDFVYILEDCKPYQKGKNSHEPDISLFKRLFSPWASKNNKKIVIGEQQQQSYDDIYCSELRYSLRSLEKYLPWHQGKIYLVVMNDSKEFLDREFFWLNTQNNHRIQIVYWKDILPEEYQPPNHSSSHSTNLQNRLEMFLDRIPGLTDRFVYMKPHYYFSNYTHPRFFFTAVPLSQMNNPSSQSLSESTRPLYEFYPNYPFKEPNPIPAFDHFYSSPTSSPPFKIQNSFNYTTHLLLQYFGPNYIETSRELEDAPLPLYRDLFAPTRTLFKEEWDAHYLNPSYQNSNNQGYTKNQKNINNSNSNNIFRFLNLEKRIKKYDLLPLYLVTNYNIFGAAQPYYPEYIVGYGKIQEKREQEEDKKKKENSRITSISRRIDNNDPDRDSIDRQSKAKISYYGFDITTKIVAKYTMKIRSFKRHEPKYNHYLMLNILQTSSQKLFFSLKWQNKDDLSTNNKRNFKKLMDYLYKEKSLFEISD